MCGRAAQTITTVRNAALLLNATMDDGSKDDAHNNDNNNNSNHLNKSPGQTFTVFTVKTGTSTEKDCHYSSSSSVKSQPQTKTIEPSTKVWGLVRKRRHPNNAAAAPAPGEHFSSNMFNARSETAHEKPSFRNLFRIGSSCIIPLSGYYEWKVDSPMKNDKKQPYYVYGSIDEKDRRCDEGSSVMFVAGFCETISRAGTGALASSNYDGKDMKMSGCALSTFTILTTSAHDKLRWLHHRQPVILTSVEDCHCWLNNPELQCTKSRQTSLQSMMWHPVTKKINKVSYKQPDCIERVRTEVESNRNIKDMFSAQKKRKLISKDNMKSSSRDSVVKRKLSRSSENPRMITDFFSKK